MFRSCSLDWGGPFSWGPGFLRGAGRSAVVLSRLAPIARFSLSAREFLSFVPCIVYFCASWWCNTYVILCHSLWWLSTCTFVLECILPHIFVLWFLYCTDASIHTWWYYRPAYVRHSSVSVSLGSGRYRLVSEPRFLPSVQPVSRLMLD